MQVLFAWKSQASADFDSARHWEAIVTRRQEQYQALSAHPLRVDCCRSGSLFLGLIHIPDMFRQWQAFSDDETAGVAWSGIAHNLLDHLPSGHCERMNATFFSQLQASGDSFLQALDGRFVLGLLEHRSRRLRVILNNYGLSQCFWTEGKYGTAVGTRIAPLLDLVGRSAVPNRRALVQLFAADQCFGTHTPFEGVHAIRQGHEVILSEDGSGIELRCHTSAEFVLNRRRDLGQEYLKIGSDAIRDTIKAQMRHSRSSLMNLTGGMDTRAIVSTVVALGGKPECDVSGLPDSREIQIAATVADALGLRLHRLHPGAQYAEGIEEWLPLWSFWTEGLAPAHLAFSRSTMALCPSLRRFYAPYFQRFSGIGGGLGSQLAYGQEMLSEKVSVEEAIFRITSGWLVSEYLNKADNAGLGDEVRDVVMEGSRLGLEGHHLYTFVYWREHLEKWGGAALTMQEFGRHVFAPLCQSLLTSVFFSMSVEEKLMRAWNQEHITRMLPHLAELPFLHPLLASPDIAPSLEARIRIGLVRNAPQLYKVIRTLKDKFYSHSRRRALSRERDKAGEYFHAYLRKLLFSGDEWWPEIIEYRQGHKIWERFVRYDETLPLWTLVTIELWAQTFLR